MTKDDFDKLKELDIKIRKFKSFREILDNNDVANNKSFSLDFSTNRSNYNFTFDETLSDDFFDSFYDFINDKILELEFNFNSLLKKG